MASVRKRGMSSLASSPEMDREMLSKVLYDPKLDADYYKVGAPCLTTIKLQGRWCRSFDPFRLR